MDKDKEFELYDALIGKDISEAEDVLPTFGTCRFVDSKIDDCVESGSDEYDALYVMMDSYDVQIDNETTHVRIYYGSDNGEITDVSA